ncbi:MAG: hypothetical protein EA394_04670 [Bacteroidia bacterium]|nr:MAG: hypothetical protein EA394_04670 [Bacteroidia bacterium]
MNKSNKLPATSPLYNKSKNNISKVIFQKSVFCFFCKKDLKWLHLHAERQKTKKRVMPGWRNW